MDEEQEQNECFKLATQITNFINKNKNIHDIRVIMGAHMISIIGTAIAFNSSKEEMLEALSVNWDVLFPVIQPRVK